MNKTAILAALGALVASDNGHWTSDGQPRVDVVEKLVNDGEVSRGDIRAVAPEFSRSNFVLPSLEDDSGVSNNDDLAGGDDGELRKALMKAKREVEEARAKHEESAQELAVANKAYDAALDAVTKEEGSESFSKGIQRFTENALKERRAKAQLDERMKQALLNVVTPTAAV